MRKSKGIEIKSIGIKVGALIFVVLIIVLGIKSAVQIKNEFNSAISQGEAFKLEQARVLASELEQRFLKANQLGQNIQANVQNTVSKIPIENRQREIVLDNVVAIFEKTPDIKGVGIYFEPNVFDGNDAKYISEESATGRFTKYVYRKNGSSDIIIENDENTDKVWYRQGMEDKQVALTEPYVDSDEGIVTSYLFPVISDGDTIGVVVVDINVNDLQQKMVDDSNGAEDFKGLITDEGTFVANAMDESMILKNLFEIIPEAKASVGEAISEGHKINEETIAGTTIPGKIIYVPVELAGVDNKWCFESVTSLNYFLAEAKKEAKLSVVVDVGIALFIGVIIVIILIHSVSKPMVLIEKTVVKFAKYNLDLAEEYEMAKKYFTRNDEVGSVVRAVDELRVNLKEIISNISNHAKSISDTSKELTVTARSTDSAATEVGDAVESIAQGAASQAQDTQSLVIEIGKSNVAVNKMLEVIEQLENQNEFIALKKTEGNESLGELVEANEKSTQTMVQISSIVNETNESAERIAKASEMIKSIAFQTNLLSLNAAIEAARAGEGGKGFSVVAEEVRDLAEQSDRFALEIEEVIKELQGKTNLAVKIMEDTKQIVQNQEEMLRKTEEKFEEISSSVDESKVIVERLDESSKVVQNANDQIASVVENLSEISEENAASAEEMSAAVGTQVSSISNISKASENLATIAAELQGEASKFRL